MEAKLSGNNVRLRAIEPEDLELLYEWENNEEIWKLSNTHAPFSRYMLKKYIETASNDIYELKELRLIIEKKDDHEAIGAIDLFDFDPFHLRAGVGILIHQPKNRGKGFASEALEICIQYAFANLGLKQLFCNITETNEQSLKLFIKRGFVITGRKIDWIKAEEGWLTEFFLQLVDKSR